MKSSDFADRLGKIAQTFEAAKASDLARALHKVTPIFRVLPGKSVADIVKRLSAHDYPPGTLFQTRVEEVANALPALDIFIKSIATNSVATDFSAFTTLLQKHSRSGLDHFIATAIEVLSTTSEKKEKATKQKRALRSDLVEIYNRRLEEALGDDAGFRHIFSQLENDKEMTSAEVSALAKRFALATAKSRDQALKKIFSRHQALMVARAASRATAGRIAG